MSKSIPLGSGRFLLISHSSTIAHSSFVPASSSSSAVCSYPFTSSSSSSSAQILASVVDLTIVHDELPPVPEVEEAVIPLPPPPPPQQSKDVIVIVDVSGSMSGVIEDVRQTVLQLGLNLTPTDRLAIVTFGSRGHVLMDLQRLPLEADFRQICQSIVIQGSTNMDEGLELAFGLASASAARRDDPERGDMIMLMLLSDGVPDKGPMALRETAVKLGSAVPPGTNLVFHSFGYTDGHDASLLQFLTSLGNSGEGLYYFLQSEDDVPASIGDCLGAATRTLLADFSISTELVFAPEEQGSSSGKEEEDCTWSSHFPGGWEEGCYNPSAPKMTVGTVMDGNRQSFVITHTPPAKHSLIVASPRPIAMRLSVSFFHLLNKEVVTEVLEFEISQETPLPNSIVLQSMFGDTLVPTNDPKGKGKGKGKGNMVEDENISDSVTNVELHALTHLLRVRVGLALARFSDPAIKESLESFERLHDVLINILGLSQQLEGTGMTFDEGILQALERDLGAGLESLSLHSSLQSLSGHFIQFSTEHLRQQSASSISNMRSTYSSPDQLAMRLRFLLSRGNPQNAEAVQKRKRDLPLEEPSLAPEALAKRTEVDELICFVSLENWREVSLGLGVLVRPRTIRERYRKLLPTIDMVEDYVSVEAYNTGIRANFTPAKLFDRDDEENEEENLMVKSSSRSRINAWLPVYLNKEHWEIAKHFAPAAFSLIATQLNDVFRPIHTLQVCARLMCATTVRFTINENLMTEKATQMYCDIHRLFLEMMNTYPEVATLADEKLKEFLTRPEKRCRRDTADLGDLIQYLTVSPQYTWNDLKEVYVQELVRRMARFAGVIVIAPIGTPEDLLLEWESRVPVSGRVSMFNKMFLDVIARPEGKSIEDVKADYDSRWGRITQGQLGQLKDGFQKIISITKVQDVLSGLGYDLSVPAIAELILWALEFRDEGAVQYDGVPKKAGKRVRLWKAKHALWKESQANPPPELAFVPPPKLPRQQHFSPIGPIQDEMNTDSSEIVVAECLCKRCLKCQAETAKISKWKEGISASASQEEPGTAHQTTLFVRGYAHTVTKDHLEVIFSSFGRVERVDFVTKASTGRSKGYSFIHFSSEKGMREAFAHFSGQKYTIDPESGSLKELRKQGAALVVDVVRHLADPSFLPERFSGRKRTANSMGQNPLEGISPTISFVLQTPQPHDEHPLPLDDLSASFVAHESWTSQETLTGLCEKLSSQTNPKVNPKSLFGKAFGENGTFVVTAHRLTQAGEAIVIPHEPNSSLGLLVCSGTLWLEISESQRNHSFKRVRVGDQQQQQQQQQKKKVTSEIFDVNTLVVVKDNYLEVELTARFWKPTWLIACTWRQSLD